jgi:hypothetical protein
VCVFVLCVSMYVCVCVFCGLSNANITAMGAVRLSLNVGVETSVSQPPGRGPIPGPGINCTGPREVLLDFVILVF